MGSILALIFAAWALLLLYASVRAGMAAGRQNEMFALPFDWRGALGAAFVEALAMLAGTVTLAFFVALIGLAGFMIFVMFGGLL